MRLDLKHARGRPGVLDPLALAPGVLGPQVDDLAAVGPGEVREEGEGRDVVAPGHHHVHLRQIPLAQARHFCQPPVRSDAMNSGVASK